MIARVYEYRLARRALRVRASDAGNGLGDTVTTASEVAALLRGRLLHVDREHFFVVHLNARNAVIGYEVVAIGTLTGVDVHPREVFRAALINGSAAIVIAHNHPSENVTPSPDDDALSERLHECGAMLGVPVLDHVIVGSTAFYSYGDHNRTPWRL